MAHIVKIITSDDGEVTNDSRWHLVFDFGDAQRTFCGGEAFGVGESGCEYDEKYGKITCQDCIDLVKQIKAIKL